MKALSIAGLAGLASLAAQAQVPNPVFVPSLDPMVVTADSRRLTEECGFVPRRSLEGGLAETVRWWSRPG